MDLEIVLKSEYQVISKNGLIYLTHLKYKIVKYYNIKKTVISKT